MAVLQSSVVAASLCMGTTGAIVWCFCQQETQWASVVLNFIVLSCNTAGR